MVPGLLGLVGVTGAGLALAPALRVLTYPFLALTVLFLARGWYLVATGRRPRTLWGRRSRLALVLSTLVAVVVWGLRFAGVLGAPPPGL